MDPELNSAWFSRVDVFGVFTCMLSYVALLFGVMAIGIRIVVITAIPVWNGVAVLLWGVCVPPY